MRNKSIFILISGALIAAPSWARECRTDTLPETTPTSRFTLSENTVTDNKTGLTWMRCAIGQHWDGKTCEGVPSTVSWDNAAGSPQKVNQSQFGGHNDWRLPVVPELASIVELQCFQPRVNTEVFPATPSLAFWSSMEKRGAKNYAYTLNFGGGEAVPTLKTESGSIRLVRGGPWWTPPNMAKQQAQATN